MVDWTSFTTFIETGYHGRILPGRYSERLQQRVSKAISHFLAFDALGTPVIPYISAWRDDHQYMWYEFAGQGIMQLLDCGPEKVSSTLRHSIVDRCIYKYPKLSPTITKETICQCDLLKSRQKLRNEVRRNGTVEAVYKIATPRHGLIWLKDQAKIEVFQDDGINLGLGVLNFVTKEMRAEEELKLAKEELKTHRDHLDDMVRSRTSELRRTQLEIVSRLAKAAEFRDKWTGQHITKMSHYCAILGKTIGIKKHLIDLLFHATPMHDVGKIGISDNILLKPSKLSVAEFSTMKNHSRIGAALLAGPNSSLLTVAKNIALTHHEKWDGSGYPQGLAGTNIPLAGRIVAVCDVFDALTSARPYKDPWPIERAIDELKNGRGSHFDPRLVDAFLHSLPKIKRIFHEVPAQHFPFCRPQTFPSTSS